MGVWVLSSIALAYRSEGIVKFLTFGIWIFFKHFTFSQEDIFNSIRSRSKEDSSYSYKGDLGSDDNLELWNHLFCYFKHKSKSNSSSDQTSIANETKLFERKLCFMFTKF